VPLAVGTAVSPPTPLYQKLDDSVVEEELARMASD
jgi:methionyl-tRNA synthetase